MPYNVFRSEALTQMGSPPWRGIVDPVLGRMVKGGIGWRPARETLLHDLAHGDYLTAA